VRDNALDNIITLGIRNDLVVVDQGGADQINGGGGNDFFYFGSTFGAGDIANGGAGTDTVGLLGGGGASFGAGQLVSVEKLAVYGGNADGTGTFSYTLTMHDGNVAAGTRLLVTAMSLGSGETLTFDGSRELDGRFAVQGGAGADTVTGGAGSDYLAGNGGADRLNGGGGNDALVGGLGADTLTGGAGADRFVYQSVAQSNGANGIDRIVDFGGAAGGERIDLSVIDANANALGNQAFTFIGVASAFTNKAGELRVVENAGNWFVQGDVDGDGVADLVIQVANGAAITWSGSDFNL
jgi:Ca2+-binding RTX toxin-like protein